MDLIIVESPTKAKTIAKFLGKKYQVSSSFGHVRDLPKSKMGIEIENGFTPTYLIPTSARKRVTDLKKQAAKAKKVILASDEDREGEAIAWHLSEVLNLNPENSERIAFHEITEEAILEALKTPRPLDMDLVEAQQARRLLDRLVGYELSPFLWKKVAKGLSAGRVQSVATRLVVEKEREIKKFAAQEYWSLNALLKTDNKEDLKAELVSVAGKTLKPLSLTEELATQYKQALEKANYQVSEIKAKQVKKNPPTPLTTSTLQQAANRQLGFSAKQTMTVAQKLYERGFITYMRTDSLNLSKKFLQESRAWLEKNLGERYIISKPRVFKQKNKNVQEAHEAIRPTEVAAHPDKINNLEGNEQRLYRLIWGRSLATQMPAAELETTSIDINAADFGLRSTGQVLVFKGYLEVYPEKTSEQVLPIVKKGDTLKLKELQTEQHFTKAPARYSDATLVRELEKHGIGRPSTYAPTINTIITRGYVSRDENKRLAPSEIAFIVNDLLVEHFPEIVDYQFTANMENELDEIAAGKINWQPVISDFYKKFHNNLELKYEEINKNEIMPEESSEEICEKCKKPMIIKTGRYGKFLACSGFPDCHNIKPLSANKKTADPQIAALSEKYKDEKCSKCGSLMAVKTGRYGPFLACTAYPKCKNIKNIGDDSLPEIICPVCGIGKIVKKFSKRGAFYACDNYPDCKTAYYGQPTGEKCPDCQDLLIKDRQGKILCSRKSCGFEK
jgi:DNA topoisomerase-1